MFDGVAEEVNGASPVEDSMGQAGVYEDDNAIQ